MNAAPPAIGLLVPASNRVMEQDFARWMPAGGRLHVNRLPAPAHRPDDMRENLRVLTTGIAEAARLVGLAEPSVIAFGCTSGSFLRGADWEEQALRDIEAARPGMRAVLTARAVTEALRAHGARRIVTISPYPETVNAQMLAYLSAQGFEVLQLAAIDGWGGGGIHNVSARQMRDLVQSTPWRDADAVLVSCTNMRAGEIVHALEEMTGKPVVTSNQATLWTALRVAGHVAPLPALGRLGLL